MCKKLSFLVSCILVLSLVSNASAVIGQKDIDSPAIPGSATEAAGVWTVTGSGADIWGTGDACYYVYRPMSGDGEIAVRMTSRTMDPLHAWSKVGIMIRESSDASSKHCAILFTAQGEGSGNEYQIAYRPETGGNSFSVFDTTPPPKMPYVIDGTPFPRGPQEFRILRVGNTIQCWWDEEVIQGNPFIRNHWLLGQVDIPMSSEVLIGLAVTSHDNGVLCTATYENVVWPPGPYEAAWDMLPVNGAGPLDTQPKTLSWMRGDSAVMHDIYLGTDPDALPLVATRPAGVETYITDPLAEATMYYWQIVEQPLDVKSPIFSFKTLRPPPYGTVQRCVWEGIGGGTNISDLTNNAAYPQSPSWCDELTQMGYYDFADEYGARMQGYLVPETSGDYTFWIAGDDSIALWLSPDEKACNLEKIAEHVGWTNAHNWFDAPEQQSAAIPLVANQKYFIRALHKEGGGGDNCQVAWFGPDQPVWPTQGNGSSIINGYFLMSADDPYATKPSPSDGITITPLEAAEPVSWAPGAGAVAHNVYAGPDPGSMTLVGTVAMPDTSIVLPPAAAGETVYWMVEADDGTQTYPNCAVWSYSVEEWVSVDIGRSNPEPPGSSSYDEATGEYTLKATGTFELWGQADEFHYLYTTMEMTRDIGSIKARVLGIEQPNEWRRAGVMIRETRAPNSRKVMAHKTGHDNTRMQWREQPSYDTWNTGDNWGLGYPLWVRVDRDGEQFNGYRSFDGENWTHLGGMWCPMQSGKYVCIGLALCHHPNVPFGEFTIGKFDNLEIYTPDPFASWNPSPADLASNVPLDVTLSWNAGQDAESHLLYISQNYDDVLYGLVSPIALPLETTSYNIGKLELGKRYYWCVDEARLEGRDLLVAFGEIWTLQIEPYRVIDDFEPYCVIPEPLPEQVEVPGEILVEAVPPPPQEMYPGEVINEDAAICTDPDRGQVLCLSGGLDYVDCGNPAALNFGTGNWSLSAWVKNTMTGTGDENKGAIIANGGDNSGGHRYCLILSEREEGKIDLVIDDNADDGTGSSYNKQQITASTAVNDGVWHHVLGVRDGDTITIYTDGVPESSMNIAADYDLVGTVQHNVLIGAITNHPDSSIYKTYGGMIDDARIYDYALTADNALFLADKGGTAPATDPIADWKFDGDFTDSSGSGFDGTPRGYTVLPASYGPLVAHYEFEGDANDSSGNHYDGTLMGGAAIVDDALVLDGTDDYVNIDGYKGVVAADGVQQPFTVSNWFRTTGNAEMVTWGTNAGQQRLSWRIDGGTLRTEHGSGNLRGNTIVNDGEWHHGALVVNEGANLQVPNTLLYVDGQQDTTFSGSDNTYNLTAGEDVSIGRRATSNDRFFNGQIDDVRIYNYALSEGEIRYIGGHGDLIIPPSYVPMVVEYNFDTDTADTSGNGNDGTLLGDAKVEDGVLKLDGAGDYLDVGDTQLTNITGQVTVSAWINLNAVGGDMKVAGNQDGSTGGYKLGVYSDNTMEFEIRTSGGSAILNRGIAGGTALSPGVWYHVVGVYSEGNYIRTYVNGRLDRELLTTEVLGGSAGTLKLGREPFSDGGYFNGMIDGVRVYNTALSYEQVSGLAGCENPITDTWFSNDNALPQLDYEVAHGGSQSMKIEFNGPFQVMRIPPFEDWTAGNAKALTMYFKGDAGNMPGLLFAQLSPGCTVEYDGSPEDLMSPDWTEWNIALADFPCDASAATLMGVGASSGSGVVRLDDMRLYPSRCVPALSWITDLNQDCSVDGKDLRILAGDYLMSDETSTGLVLRYEFEGNLEDSSGFGRHGTAHGSGITFEDDPNRGMVLSLPGGDDIYVSAPPVGISGNMPTTIACWAKADHTSIPDWTLVFGFSTPGGDCGSHFNIGSIGGPGGVGAHCWCWEETIFTDEEALDWRHYAMTYDGSKIEYYGDGILKDTDVGKSNYQDLWRRGDYVNVGKRNTQASSFPGKVDDARIYKRVLSEAEIGTVMAGGEVAEVYFPLESIANIYDEEPANSKIVNLKDYALIGKDWLNQIVWP